MECHFGDSQTMTYELTLVRLTWDRITGLSHQLGDEVSRVSCSTETSEGKRTRSTSIFKLSLEHFQVTSQLLVSLLQLLDLLQVFHVSLLQARYRSPFTFQYVLEERRRLIRCLQVAVVVDLGFFCESLCCLVVFLFD